LTRKLTIAIIISTFYSCGSGLKVNKSKVQILTPLFAARIANTPHKITPEKEFSKVNLKLLAIFRETTEDIDSLDIYFNSNKELTLEFKYNGQEFLKTFKGQFSKRGYYEFYLDKKKIEIPPIFPILYSKVNIDRYRIGLTTEGDLIVDQLHENMGNILIISAGYQYRLQTFHKCRKKL
jgi:hypothetical protein